MCGPLEKKIAKPQINNVTAAVTGEFVVTHGNFSDMIKAVLLPP